MELLHIRISPGAALAPVVDWLNMNWHGLFRPASRGIEAALTRSETRLLLPVALTQVAGLADGAAGDGDTGPRHPDRAVAGHHAGRRAGPGRHRLCDGPPRRPPGAAIGALRRSPRITGERAPHHPIPDPAGVMY